MILLNSNAEHIFSVRPLFNAHTIFMQFISVSRCLMMQSNYAHAFCLPAFDAGSINELVLNPEQPASFSSQFKCARGNIQDLRGVLSAKSYAELNSLFEMPVIILVISVTW